MTPSSEKRLHISFHGRIIDSLGIQMYQSPVAAIAELIANAWDADATEVEISLPEDLDETAEISIRDNGAGMTFEECQNHYLNVGRNRRTEPRGNRTTGGRPCLGRKGIGKFAGFGIADVVEVDTISAETGEHTIFRLYLEKLRSLQFVSTEGQEIEVVLAGGPEEDQKGAHGTTIYLRSLKLSQRRSPETLARQMARRFLLALQSDEFRVTVNGLELPPDEELQAVQFEFPRDYAAAERPSGLVEADGWGIETLPDGNRISWRVRFARSTITMEEFRGIAVFCGIKVAQTPFFFLLSGGLGGQHGQQYLTGTVQADYLDRGTRDVITTERQRINWEDPTTAPLLKWGQERLKQLLIIWQERRAEEKIRAIDERIAEFSERLSKLPRSEAETVRRALRRIASIEAIDAGDFESLASAVLTAWEAGRLRQIIEDVARIDQMDAAVLLSLLTEQQVLSALHAAEIVKLRLDVINGLRHRIEQRELELAIRDYLAKHPWLISARWETFRVERRIDRLVSDTLGECGIASAPDWTGRVDLALSGGEDLLVVEFMRPGLTIDRDHMQRFQTYIDILESRVRANSGLGLTKISGLLVADRLDRRPENRSLIERMARSGMFCEEWSVLLRNAAAQWEEFLGILAERSPDDMRMRSLRGPA
jgi:hypothetical protein